MENTPHSAVSMSAAEREELVRIARPVRDAGATPQATVRSTILDLCSGRFLSLRELAELLNRSPEALRNEYISKMVRAGQLELRHPENPRHRQQAYRAAVPVGEAK